MTQQAKPTIPSRRQSGHERVLAAVKHALAEGRYENAMLPSYRQLCRELNVSKASVEWAMAKLEREGLIRRESGRGVFPIAHPRSDVSKKPLPLHCINFLRTTSSVLPSFVEDDYLASYTAALDYLDIRMRFVASDELDSRKKGLLAPLPPVNAQGVVLINSCPVELMEWLNTNGVPFVVQYYTSYDAEDMPAHSRIYVNKSRGAFEAVNYLLELGHRRIGFIGPVGPDRLDACVRDSVFEGYCAALNCAGLPLAKNDIANCRTRNLIEVFAAAKALLDRPNRPTAILATSDAYARLLLDVARELNLRVPEDLSIIGFDNQPEYEPASPLLTTVSIPRRELARGAVELLLKTAERPQGPPQTRILDTHLIIRETTAPPRATHAEDSADSLLAQS